MITRKRTWTETFTWSPTSTYRSHRSLARKYCKYYAINSHCTPVYVLFFLIRLWLLFFLSFFFYFFTVNSIPLSFQNLANLVSAVLLVFTTLSRVTNLSCALLNLWQRYPEFILVLFTSAYTRFIPINAKWYIPINLSHTTSRWEKEQLRVQSSVLIPATLKMRSYPLN